MAARRKDLCLIIEDFCPFLTILGVMTEKFSGWPSKSQPLNFPCYNSLSLRQLLYLLDNLGTLFHCLHVQGDEVVMALGQRFLEGLLHALIADHGSHLQQTAKNNHVKDLAVLHLGSLVHRIDAIDGDVLARRLVDSG